MRGMGRSGVAVVEPQGDEQSPKRADLTSDRVWLPLSELEFPGCDPRPMTVAEYEALPDERVEFFDSEAGIAWIVRESPSFAHADPAQKLGRLVERIAQARGSLILSRGEAGFRFLHPVSRKWRAVHPDNMVFLHPERLGGMGVDYLRIGRDPYPDVVFEVDNTTDVRLNRLKLYEGWGFPEVWVEVPEAATTGRRPGLKRGLGIHLLEGGRYVLSEESRAFPGWRAADIHRALNQWWISEETSAILTRVGRTLGEREGTGPEDDPLLREQRAEGRAEGHAAGHTAGRAEGRAEERARLARAMLASRGIVVPPDFPSADDRAALAAAAAGTVVAAAGVAGSASDFLSRLRPDDPDRTS